MFYLQGKAYHAGYLAYFHLDNTQMSISTSDAMWLPIAPGAMAPPISC